MKNITKDNTFDNFSDEDLVQFILSGNVSLSNVLSKRYYNKVYSKCIAMLHDKVTAADLCQDIFVKIFLNLASFRGDAKFSTWVYRITYHTGIDYLRQKKNNRLVEIDDNEEESLFLDKDFENDAIQEKWLFEVKSDRLKELIMEILPDYRFILLLKYQDGESIENIMKILNKGESAVKMQLKRARESLKKHYDKKYKQPE